MDIHERMLSLAGREVLFRPIIFERYRKPHVVEYPRHATVLNPHHTQQQQQLQSRSLPGGDGHNSRVGNGHLSHSNSETDDDSESAGGKRGGAHRDRGSDDDDDDDPRFLAPEDFLCSDATLEKVLHLRWREVGPVGLGLVNLGNTCFANAVLQAIAYTPALAQFFAETYRAADTQLGAPYDFAFALGETVRQMHLRRGGGAATGTSGGGRGSHHSQPHQGSYRPGLIVGHLRTLSPHFSLGKQSDAHEFAVQLLFGCQQSLLYRLVGSKKLPLRVTHTTALSRICGGYLRSQVRWSRQDEIQQLLKAGKQQAATDLKMEKRNRSKSQDGDALTSNTYDPMNVLHIELAGHTLEHCLAKFCEVERLHGRCYHSPRDVAVVATKQMKIHVAPNVLMIHLKRFTPTGGKHGKHVQYPMKLNLYPYTTACERAKHEKQATPEHPQYMYELNAICVHEGSSINYGHYYAVVRARNGAWYECNDASVYPLNEAKALNQQAYMLFYSRIPTDRTKAPPPQQQRYTTQQLHSEQRSSRSASTQPPAQRETEFVVGEALTDEQVAALLAARKHQPPTASAARTALPNGVNSGSGDDEARGSGDSAAQAKRSKNKFSAEPRTAGPTLKRRRDDLSTDEDDDTDPAHAGTRTAAERGEQQHESDADPPVNRRQADPSQEAAAQSPSERGGEARVQQQSLRKSLYGGVVRAMRVNPATPLQRALKARQGGPVAAASASRAQDERGERRHGGDPQTRALGRAAVIALEEQKQAATPATVRREGTAPKFQQRIRDAMWEMEMDKGRVKKVRRKADDGDPNDTHTNRFQTASTNRFDRRGRRVQHDAEHADPQ